MSVPPSPQEYLQYLITHKDTVLAPWVAGCVADLYAAGIFTSMVVRYFSRSDVPKDSNKTRMFVVLVAVLSAYKSAAALYILFLFSVILSGDQVRLTVATLTNVVLVTSSLTTQFVDLAVQSYYVALLWQIFRLDGGRRFHPSLRWGLFAGICLLAILGVTMACLAVAEMLSLRFLNVPEYLATQLAASFLCDAFISIGTVYCLLKSNRYSANDRNRSMFNKIARLIALSAAIPAVCALLNVSIVAANVFYNRWHVFFDFALSKAFAISFMWTIETRRNIRHAETIERNSDHTGPNQSPHHLSQAFFESRFAATVQIPPLAQTTIEMGNPQQQRPRDNMRDRQSISGSGHSGHGNFLDMKT
ncbi:hypothetical protein M408DRAFT_28291 [Serendipita vermifera MAFF 305830]|uniref:DUF6534 domain-containing protein n=1 Tax=Serendipita vermifera MAFF 305830 TaxID=933852 RepID=A0A0C3AE58_SERVB|nr:hypothetical protein M408DRAFT_28291 [Serendipita vermifera MAFF 305830]